jgi:hypothetical protein
VESGCLTLGRGQPETFTYGASNVEKKYISILKAYEPFTDIGKWLIFLLKKKES